MRANTKERTTKFIFTWHYLTRHQRLRIFAISGQLVIFTMVSYFLRWTLLKFFSSIPDEQSQQKVRRLGRITCAVIDTSNEVKCPLLWEFWIYNFSRRILERVLVRNIVNIRNECLFFWVHGGMNRSAEQTNHSRTASRFTRFVCPALRFIPPWTQKKRHSFLK